MVEFTLPKNSKVREGKTWPQPAGAHETREYPNYRWNPADCDGHTGQGVAAVQGRPRQARWTLRVHPVRLLLDVMPELLVESRALSRSRRAAAGAALARRLAR